MPKVMTIGSLRDSDVLPAGAFEGPVGRLRGLGSVKGTREQPQCCVYANYKKIACFKTKKEAADFYHEYRGSMRSDCNGAATYAHSVKGLGSVKRGRSATGMITIEGSLKGVRKRKTRKKRR